MTDVCYFPFSFDFQYFHHNVVNCDAICIPFDVCDISWMYILMTFNILKIPSYIIYNIPFINSVSALILRLQYTSLSPLHQCTYVF